MPHCVVKGCKSHTSKNKKEDGITFHTFPKRNINVTEKWIEVIRASRDEPLWHPTNGSVVCSAHFKSDELYYTKQKGLRRVVQNGYPKIFPDMPDRLDNAVFSQTPDVHLSAIADTEAAAPDLSYLNKPPAVSASYTVQTAVPDLSFSDLNQPSTTSTASHSVQTAVPDLSFTDSNQPSASCAVQQLQVELDPSMFYAPKKYNLRKRILFLEKKQEKNLRKIKTLRQKVRRIHMRNKSLKKVVIDLFNALNIKKSKKNIKYTPAMKTFCLTLNYHSPKAYEYVRSTINTGLPHPKTLAKWYSHIKEIPDTEESSQALKARNSLL